jgi:inhibitor of KinA sporulation pathway (predicted exonuclease)
MTKPLNYIILDLEATCWAIGGYGASDERKPISEVIEIGAVKARLIDNKFEVMDTFQSFIKPKLNPILSDFCKELTTIKQEDVDAASIFPVVIDEFKRWISDDGESMYLLTSWGFYDAKQLKLDCLLHDLEVEWVNPHISLKHQFNSAMNLTSRKRVGMPAALRILGLEQKGTHHRGIDDALNIFEIFKVMAPNLKIMFSHV